MNSVLLYRISLGFSILCTIAAFFTLLGGIAPIVNGWGKVPWTALVPWTTIILLALTALNCTLRARLIVRRRRA